MDTKHSCVELDHDQFFGGGTWRCTCGEDGRTEQGSAADLVNDFLTHVVKVADQPPCDHVWGPCGVCHTCGLVTQHGEDDWECDCPCPTCGLIDGHDWPVHKARWGVKDEPIKKVLTKTGAVPPDIWCRCNWHRLPHHWALCASEKKQEG